MKYLLLFLVACSSSKDPDPVTIAPSIKHVRKDPDPVTIDPSIKHVRSMGAPAWTGMQRMGFCTRATGPLRGPDVIFDCNSPNEPFMEVLDCKAPFFLHDGCLQFDYSAHSWHLEIDLIAQYAHARSLAAALATQGVVVAGLGPDKDDADQCEVCEREHAGIDCYRAVVNDPRNKLLWFIPCVGPARSEPQ